MYSKNKIVNEKCRKQCGNPLVFKYLLCQWQKPNSDYCDNKILNDSIKCFNQCDNIEKNLIY